MATETRHLDARGAAKRLGVSVTTLYAYVSRGQIRSEPIPGSRKRRYLAADVERLRLRQRARRNPSRAARESLHFDGMPVLDSSITLIDGGRLFYRGHDAIAWAERATLEETAGLLWNAPLPGDQPPAVPWVRLAEDLPLAEAFATFLAAAAPLDSTAYDLRPSGVRRSGARILRGLAAVAARTEPGAGGVADTLRNGWGMRARDAKRALNAALVVCADHELNVSAFTARCVASARSSPYAAVAGAIAAVQGFKHGGHTHLVADLLDSVRDAHGPDEAIDRLLRRGQPLPGFGHALYPDGDPRAAFLLRIARALRPRSLAWRRIDEMLDHARSRLSVEPNVDFGLVALARVMGMPAHAPFMLFVLGRTVGWIAHALEQYEDDKMIRPRARYVGPMPD